MIIKINSHEVNLHPSSCEENLKLSFSFMHGRKLTDEKHGIKKISLNDLISSVKDAALKKDQDLGELQALRKVFTDLNNKGYEKGGLIDKKKFFIRLLTKIKHLFSKVYRKKLLKELDQIIDKRSKTVPTELIKNISQDLTKIGETTTNNYKDVVPSPSPNPKHLELLKAAEACPLSYAVVFRDMKKIQELIKVKESLDSVDKRGMSPLHYAILVGDLEMLQLLAPLVKNINRQMEGTKGTYLSTALLLKDEKMVECLLNNGADPNLTYKLTADAQVERCLLFWTIIIGHKKFIELLTPLTHNISLVYSQALIFAVSVKKMEVIHFLLEKNVNIDFQEELGCRPLQVAVATGCVEIVKLLAPLTKDINAIDADMMTALHCAATKHNLEIINVLLDNHADVNISSNKGLLPLHLAASYGDLDIIKRLTPLTKNINTLDKNGLTPLAYASKKGQVEVVKYLLDQGADANTVLGGGNLALHLAVNEGNLDVVNVLLSATNRDQKNDEGHTPLDLAITAYGTELDKKKLPIVDLLLSLEKV